MTEYYLMNPKDCFLCKDSDGMQEDWTPNAPLYKQCDHKISVGVLESRITELEATLKELKRSKRSAKIIRGDDV